MNRKNELSFRTIQAGIANYKRDVRDYFEEYQKQAAVAKEAVQEYKDPEKKLGEILAPKKALTRNAVNSAKPRMNEIVKEEIKSLTGELQNHSLQMPSETLVRSCEIFKTFNIPLTRRQVEGLVKQAGGSITGYRMIEQTMQATATPYRLSYVGLDTLENDIDTLEKLVSDYGVWLPVENGALDIFGGEQLPGGNAGTVYTPINMVTQQNNFERLEKEIEGMKARWIDSVIPTVEQVTDSALYDGTAKEKAAAYMSDRRSTGSVDIENKSVAEEIAQRLTKDKPNYNDILDNYRS